MANTYSSLFYHIVFSTKNRKRFITKDIESRIWAYLDGITRKKGAKAVSIGGMEDHIHALILSPPKMAPSRIVQSLKGRSSKWIHSELPNLRTFAWQDGFSAFSVSRSAVPKVVHYIQNQRLHHQSASFEDEYKLMLDLHGVDTGTDEFLFG